MLEKDFATKLLERSLEASSLRNRVLANNIANAGTPGFKRSRVDFEQQLVQALQGQDVKADPAEVAPEVVQETQTAGRTDGNNVDIELEMTELAENQVWYSALTRQISDHFARLRMVINDGRR